MATVLSTHPGLSAAVACFPGVLRGEDSAQPPLQLTVGSPAAAELLLEAVLRVLASLLALRPLALLPTLAPRLLPASRHLLLGGSLRLQTGAMRCLAAAALAAPPGALGLPSLMDALEAACQRWAGRLAAAQPSAALEWQQALAELLQALSEVASAGPAQALLLPRVAALAAGAAAWPCATPLLQVPLCRLFLGAVLRQPPLLEAHPHLLQLLRTCDDSARSALHQAVLVCLQAHPAPQVHAALQVALAARGALPSGAPAPAAAAAAAAAAVEGGASARKRRRLRATPKKVARAAEGAEPVAAAGHADEGLHGVAVALAALAPEAGPQAHDVEALAALASLLAILTAVAPAQASALAAAQLPHMLEHAAVAEGGASGAAHLEAELLLVATALQAVLVHAAASDASPTSLLEGVEPEHLGELLRRAWQPPAAAHAVPGGREAPAAEGEVEPPSGGARALALCAALAAVQAGVLDASLTLLDMLRSALGGADSDAVTAAAAALLPAACIVVGHTTAAGGHQQGGGSQGHRPTQRERRARAAAPPPPPPSPAVQLLQEALRGLGPRATLALARGLDLALRHAHEPATLVSAAADEALGGTGPLHAWPSPPDCNPGLNSFVSKWAHEALDTLCCSPKSDGSVARGGTVGGAAAAAAVGSGAVQAALVAAAATYLTHGSLGQVEHSRRLATWLLGQCSTRAAPVRAALLARGGALLTQPGVVLALFHEGAHPVHSRDRAAAVERYETEVLKASGLPWSRCRCRRHRHALPWRPPAALWRWSWKRVCGSCASTLQGLYRHEPPPPLRQALKGQLEAVPGGGGASSTREALLQLIAHAGSRMRSHPAQLLLLAILVLQLDGPEPGPRATAAAALAGLAALRRCRLPDLLLTSPRLLELVGRHLATKVRACRCASVCLLRGLFVPACVCGARSGCHLLGDGRCSAGAGQWEYGGSVPL